MGVLKPNTDMDPTGVSTNCDIVLLGVGVTVKTPCLVVVPPNVAIKLDETVKILGCHVDVRRIVLRSDRYIRRCRNGLRGNRERMLPARQTAACNKNNDPEKHRPKRSASLHRNCSFCSFLRLSHRMSRQEKYKSFPGALTSKVRG